MEGIEIDKRIIKLLEDRGYKGEEIDKFLNPDISMLNDPFKLKNMSEAVERIERAIKSNEKIVVYGDYDCDGISACVILYKYFKARGVNIDVYIPSRFDDGYGLSFDMIDQVIEKSKPNLIITVDLGVTAYKEVEKIQNSGIDIIVTDHHEPASIIPSCLVVDPKIAGQEYPFNGLCGAGVALKLVEALSGRDEAIKYLDICAIATIGDIVPLTDENRFIAKRGIEKINSGDCLVSYKFMLSELGIKKLSGSDVTFKLVPRINASGRMTNGKKVFDFLIEEDKTKLKELYDSIIEDNNIRLDSISEGAQILEEKIKTIDLQNDSVIMLEGDFHQGVLGILASRICHDYNRPAIIFTKTAEGTLKGSGRSLDEVDLHLALKECEPLLIRFGGHKMAIGVEVSEENFEKLKQSLKKNVLKQVNFRAFKLAEQYDIEISDKDINEKFINSLNLLEPFGCKNEKPILMMQATSLKVTQMKDASYRHFKLTTKNGKSIVAFSAAKHVDALKSDCKKHLIVDLENNEYKGKMYPQAILKNVFIKEINLRENKENEAIISLVNKYFAENKKINENFYNQNELDSLLEKLSKTQFGTIVIVDSKKEAERVKVLIKNLKNFTLSHIPLKNGQNTILVSSNGILTEEAVKSYNNIVFTRQDFAHEKAGFLGKVFVPKVLSNFPYELNFSREDSVFNYNMIKKYANVIRANDTFEWLDKIKQFEGSINKISLVFSMLGFLELGFIKINFDGDFAVEVVDNPPKKDLSKSQFMKTKRVNYGRI